MSFEKPNFRAQPAVKSIFMYRNGDAHTEARRVLIHEKRVRDFETLLREVTGHVRAPFGAVRSIYTPRAGHRVDALEQVRHGEQYVAAGREKFKKLDYLQVGSRKKQMPQNNGTVKTTSQYRRTVTARFLKPIKEPCTIFAVANGDLRNPAVRCLVPDRLLFQFERILEMITEKMGLRILGGVHSLYSLEGVLVTAGKDLENGQFYVAVGREKFKRLPYADSLFCKPVGMRRNVRSKTASLPPIYTCTRQNGDAINDTNKTQENMNDELKTVDLAVSLVRKISQARLMALRKKRSSLSKSHNSQDNDDSDPKPKSEIEKSLWKTRNHQLSRCGLYSLFLLAVISTVFLLTVASIQACSTESEAAKEKNAAGEMEEELAEKEETAAQEEEAAKKQAAAQEKNAAAEKEERVAQEGKTAAEKEEAAAENQEAATHDDKAAAEKEKAVTKEEEAAEGKEETPEEEKAVEGNGKGAEAEKEAAVKEEEEVGAVAEFESAVENEAPDDRAGQPEEPSEKQEQEMEREMRW